MVAPQFEELHADLDRVSDPDVGEDDAQQLRDGNAELGLALLRAIAETEDKDSAVSAYSLQSAFAMLYAAAKGDSETEIDSTMRFLGDQQRTHSAMNGLDLALMSRNLTETDDEDPVIVATANRLFARLDFEVADDYLNLLALNYGAGVFLADFINDTEGSRKKINRWVEVQTQNRIVDLLPDDALSPNTAWVLVNAIYLKAPWVYQFSPQATQNMPFTTLDSGEKSVSTMHGEKLYGSYLETDEVKVVDLPLRGEKLSMTFILPSDGTFLQFEQELDLAKLDGLLAELKQGELEVYLPKFKVETGSLKLNKILREMGMTAPFDAADFSGFGPHGAATEIESVYHSVFVAVDELGVEAAAATAIEGEDSAPMPEITFDAHRPFLFLLRDRPTGAVLFTGRVIDPDF